MHSHTTLVVDFRARRVCTARDVHTWTTWPGTIMSPREGCPSHMGSNDRTETCVIAEMRRLEQVLCENFMGTKCSLNSPWWLDTPLLVLVKLCVRNCDRVGSVRQSRRSLVDGGT